MSATSALPHGASRSIDGGFRKHPMDAATILRLGAAMLASGSLGLFLVRASNHRLRGLGWLGAAFASGFLGALLLTLPHVSPIVSVLGSDVCVLLGFCLLQVAVVEMMTQRNVIPRTSFVLIALLVVVDVLYMSGAVRNLRVITVSLLVAAQCVRTAWLLWRAARHSERGPAMFCALLLATFAAFNLVRAGVVLTANQNNWHWHTIVVTFSYALYIAVALGLAFGFFWMSTAQLSHQLEHMAGTDPLTRLYNRRTFLKACEQELETSQQKQRPFSILMVDLDHFKKINDKFGHSVGDAALVAAVHAMQDSIRGSDILARWGGEEFAALLPNASLEAAHVVAERLRINVERVEMPLEVTGPNGPEIVRMTVSIGLATYDSMDDIQTVMSRADQNLYLAKDSGRNRVLADRTFRVPATVQ